MCIGIVAAKKEWVLMADLIAEVVEDKKGTLAKSDHDDGMERVCLTVNSLHTPFPSIVRVKGRVETDQPEIWQAPNLAIRLEVAEIPGKRPISRVYTVRSFDSNTNEIEVDFVLHEDESPAMLWLRNCEPGSTIHLTGPRPHFVPKQDAQLPVAMFADETAIPAVYSILQAWPAGQKGDIYVEAATIDPINELPEVEGVVISPIVRGPNEPAGVKMNLLAAAKSAPQSASMQVWIACERQEARELRKFFGQDVGISTDNLQAIGYWRKGASSSEIDRKRLKFIESLVEEGKGINNFSDFDIDI